MKIRPLLLPFFSIGIVFFFFLFAFRSLLFHFDTNLLDWNDYPFYVWTLYQNIRHIQSLDFRHFFETSVYSGYTSSLLFSDLLLPQSLIALPFAFVFANPIRVFNIVFFLTLFLNCTSVYFFWKHVFSTERSIFLALFATCISGFVFQNSVHFQFLSFWPFFFGLGYLVKHKKKTSDAYWIGFWTAVQFLSGVYLSIFLMTTIGIWYCLVLFTANEKWSVFRQVMSDLLRAILIFLLLAGFFVAKYRIVQNQYQITRQYWEYVHYAASLSDYMFSSNYNSVISSIFPMSKWNAYNKAGSLFPGFLLTSLCLCSLFFLHRKRSELMFGLKIEKKDLFFFVILCFGFISSLGPRLSVNGYFVDIPLPYAIALKLIPFFEPIRVNSRWYLFVCIAIVYFAIKRLEKMVFSRYLFYVALCCLIIALEVLPIYRVTEQKNYYHQTYYPLESACAQTKQVLLEYPMTQQTDAVNIVTNLTYRTQAMLASVRHGCVLVNGYMGYAPASYDQYESDLRRSVDTNNSSNFWSLVASKNVHFIKLNTNDLYQDKVAIVRGFFAKNPFVHIVAESQNTLLVQIQ